MPAPVTQATSPFAAAALQASGLVSVGNTVPDMSAMSSAEATGNLRGRSVSRGRRGKRSGPTFAQVTAKKPRQDHPFKLEVWQKSNGKREPISFAAWKQMDTLLCIAAAEKVRGEGPPTGGMGLKNWTQHTHPGSDKAAQLPPEERMGHAVLRFSTMEAQEWYRPLVRAAMGIDTDGNPVQLSEDAQSDDPRARYTASLLNSNFITFGDTEEERKDLLMKIILAAIGVGQLEECGTAPSRMLTAEGKEDLYSFGLRFPPLVETALDKILLQQRYGILPTAICPVRFLKQRKTETPEERLISATNNLKMAGPGKSRRSSSGSTPQPATKAAPNMATPDK